MKQIFRGWVPAFLMIGFGMAAPSTVAHANPVFGYTHMLPSPYTLPAGRLVYGTQIAMGITDFFQIGTDVIRDYFKNFNANAKLSLLDFPEFAFSPYVGWETFNYRDISSLNPDLRVTSWTPGAVAAFSLSDQLAWFVGGNAYVTKMSLVHDDVQTSGVVHGAVGETDLSWAYGSGASRRRGKKETSGPGNVLSAGTSYDFTFKLFGVGVSHHWPGFHIGVHYYPAAKNNPVVPILVGGGSVDL